MRKKCRGSPQCQLVMETGKAGRKRKNPKGSQEAWPGRVCVWGGRGARCGCTCGERDKGIIPLQAPLLIQEVLWVEPFRAFKFGAIMQDGAEHGKDFCALRKRRSRGSFAQVALNAQVIWGRQPRDNLPFCSDRAGAGLDTCRVPGFSYRSVLLILWDPIDTLLPSHLAGWVGEEGALPLGH